VDVEHEVGERTLEPRPQLPIDGETGTGDLRGTLQIEDAELLAELPVGLRCAPQIARQARKHVEDWEYA
jgi:hypothetical protein